MYEICETEKIVVQAPYMSEEEKEKFPEKRKVSAIRDEGHKICLISAKAHCTQAECICSV